MPNNLAVCSLFYARWERLTTATASRAKVDTIGRVGKQYNVG